MAKLYTDATGVLLRLDVTPAALQQPAPANTAATLDFDPATNPALVVNVQLQPGAVRYDGAVVTIGGQPHAVEAATAAYQQQQAAILSAQAAIDSLTTYLGLASPTAVQTTQAVQLLAKVVRYLLRQAVAG